MQTGLILLSFGVFLIIIEDANGALARRVRSLESDEMRNMMKKLEVYMEDDSTEESEEEKKKITDGIELIENSSSEESNSESKEEDDDSKEAMSLHFIDADHGKVVQNSDEH